MNELPWQPLLWQLSTPRELFRLVGAPEDMAVNARAPQCITGGAGGASAAAVAAGEVSFAVDTDHLAGVRVRAAQILTRLLEASPG